MLTAELLSQGSELLSGDIADTNATWLAAELDLLGFRLGRISTIGDVITDIAGVLLEIAGRSQLCLCTGGLGPTEDDCTAEAVAQAFGRPLQQDSKALQNIQDHYIRIGRPMSAANLKQANLPKNTERLDNAWGTAPGFALWEQGTWFIFLPGVPVEMRAMYTHLIKPRLHAHFSPKSGRRIVLRTTGLGESNLQEKIGPFQHTFMRLGYRTISPEVQITLRIPAKVAQQEWQETLTILKAQIGKFLFAVEDSEKDTDLDLGLARIVGRLLQSRQESIAVAESCTGGLLACWCTALAGASVWFREGVVSYSNAAKIRYLAVRKTSLLLHGAVSSQIAREMATGIRKVSGATYGLALTGIAGPGGGTEAKPVGTVYIAIATPDGVLHRCLNLVGERNRVQQDSAMTVLDLLRCHLLYSSGISKH